MNLLGIDTSTAASAACVLRGDGEPFEHIPRPEHLIGRPGHASELLPAIAGCLERARIGWDEIDAVAVGVGPGAFTGLRIGIATARALAGAHGAELRPVSSLAALAEDAPSTSAHGERADSGQNAAAAGPDRESRQSGRVLATIDARRGEVFAALYGDDGEPLWEPFAAAPEAVAERLRAEGIAPLAVGDGAVRFREVLEAAGARVPPSDSRDHVVRALAVCRLAAAASPVPLEAVLPDYQRLPDATPTPT